MTAFVKWKVLHTILAPGVWQELLCHNIPVEYKGPYTLCHFPPEYRPTDHDPPLYEWGWNLLHLGSYMSGWCCADELQVLIELPGSDYKIC